MTIADQPFLTAPPASAPPDHGGPVERVAVIGTGYVGLTTATCLAHLGRQVTAIDIDAAKVEALQAGRIPITEDGIEPLLERALDDQRLHFAFGDAGDRACRSADLVLLCLPTPHGGHLGPDLAAVEAACRHLGPLLQPGAMVVTKSTVPVGTHARVARWLGRDDVAVASNPEFLREGTAIDDFLHPDRIVIGATAEPIGRRVATLYRGVDAPVLITDPTSAELVKYAANTFLATKLSFINEISRLSESLGADVDQVVAGLGSDHRIGPRFLTPGPGWGGSCFPKDTRGLAHIARSAGHYLPVIEAAYRSNVQHLDHLVGRIIAQLPERSDRRVAIWGAAFKAGTDDVRESPALGLADRLVEQGIDVVIHDPVVSSDAIGHPMAPDELTACQGADLLVVATEWPHYATVDLDEVFDRLRSPVVYDTRSIIDPIVAAHAGLTVRRPGGSA